MVTRDNSNMPAGGVSAGNWDACMTAVAAAAGGRLTDNDLHAVLETIIDRARASAGQAPLPRENIGRTVGAALSAEERAAAAIERANKIRNLNVLPRIEARLEAHDDTARGLSELLVGSEHGTTDAARSIAAEIDFRRAQVRAALEQDLREAGVFDRARNGRKDPDFELAVAKEMAILSGYGPPPPAGAAVAPDVRATAEIFTRYQEAMRQARNEQGAYIGALPGFIVSQSHDQVRIRGAGRDADFARWRDFILPRLDPSTFEGHADRAAFLREAWLGLSTGIHQRLGTPGSEWLTGFKGPGNLAKKLSSERVLIFNSPEDWFTYDRQFGRGSLWDAVNTGLDKGAADVALMRNLGTNPEAMFNAIRDRAIDRARKAGRLGEVDALQKKTLGWKFEEIAGLANVPDNPRAAMIAQTVRNFISAASLGFSTISSFGDLGSRAAVLRHNGVSFLGGLHDGLASLVKSLEHEDAREVLTHLGVMSEAMSGSITSKLMAADGVPGFGARMLRQFYKFNGQEFWTDRLKGSVALALSHNLANLADREFAALPDRLRVNLRRFGIEENEWALLSKGRTEMADGRAHLTPDMVHHIDDSAIALYHGLATGETEAMSAGKIARVRDDLETRLGSYFIDQVREAMSETTARERVYLKLGTKPGSAVGEAVRMFMQLKSFPLTHTMRMWGREVTRNGADWGGIMSTVLTMTALGYLSMVTKDALKGKTPRVPDFQNHPLGSSVDVFASAMAQGGGLGLLGDLMLGEFNRFGGGGLETLAGPAVGRVSQMLRLFGEAKEDFKTRPGKLGVAASHGLTALASWVPFSNVFYTKAAVDYLFLYHVQEFLNPGFLKRTEARMKRENNQTYWLAPSSVNAAFRGALH
jgi:hypothetical protein